MEQNVGANDLLLNPEQLNVSVDWVRDHSSRKKPLLPVVRLGGGPGRPSGAKIKAVEGSKQ